MAMVLKGNSLISVPDNRVDDYLARGYSIADESGTVIKKAVPTDKSELQKLYTDQVAKIAELEKKLAEQSDTTELDALKAELEAYKERCEELEKENNALKAEIQQLKAPTPRKRVKKSE